jgi:hypothetical protein
MPPLNCSTFTRQRWPASRLYYSVSADIDGETWPQDLLSDDGETRGSWHRFLIHNLAEILPGIFRGESTS